MHYGLDRDLPSNHLFVKLNELNEPVSDPIKQEVISPEVASERNFKLSREGSEYWWLKDPAGP